MNPAIAEDMEATIDEIKRFEHRLEGTDKVGLFQLRRKLEKAVFEQAKQGERIPLRVDFELTCDVCGVVQDNEDQYYLHLRKAHRVKDHDAVDAANKQGEEWNHETQELRRLMTKYTDFDLEDDFTRGFNRQEPDEADDSDPVSDTANA